MKKGQMREWVHLAGWLRSWGWVFLRHPGQRGGGGMMTVVGKVWGRCQGWERLRCVWRWGLSGGGSWR